MAQCSVEGCGKRLRSDNTSGFCVAHRDRAPHRSCNRRNEAQRAENRATALAWYNANKVKAAETFKRRYDANREHFLAKRKRWAEANPYKETARVERRRARAVAAPGDFTAQEWSEKLAEYGHVCAACGSASALTVDHIVPLSKGGTNWIDNTQPLCRGCNSAKGDRHSTHYPPRHPGKQAG